MKRGYKQLCSKELFVFSSDPWVNSSLSQAYDINLYAVMSVDVFLFDLASFVATVLSKTHLSGKYQDFSSVPLQWDYNYPK